ncbi:oxidation resistance protein [Emiliania huxleyi CCMP1516]|uniref:Oxidation resistance protein 1 n=2 Tax=Emiliania huxleyi TaxID=2903 RepID=A0A0D3IKP2_EMIH1|nr:oxidation resistance protein [Emiliania huxleyi CCMP1516]EOD11827.1 oxidation resistance protein [Emiliania huxleyi CCMP1516]|eukprot:XP_005764256.1 oxidation resistance protein [Emiliania huxleyi CCMP1516]
MASHDGSGPHAAKFYVPRLLSTSGEPSSSHVLSECAIRQLAPQVPRRYALSDWRLLYSTHVHGISINTLYLRASGCGGCLLALRSSDGATFGGFISECQPPSAPGPDGRHFYGNGESFLWRVEPLTDLPPLPRPSMGEPPTCLLETFGWTGANTYFALSHREHLALGSGGHFGLWIDADLRHGSSGASDTYGDPSPWTRHSAARALNGAASQLHA